MFLLGSVFERNIYIMWCRKLQMRKLGAVLLNEQVIYWKPKIPVAIKNQTYHTIIRNSRRLAPAKGRHYNWCLNFGRWY